ncbi:MAG TPA: hypothetical protein VGV35_18510 [Bryobacteraceae bacterium]|nr:hypothetical protein [Bryobacteraceae bacterium]
MTLGEHLIRIIQNNITLIVALAILFLMVSAWIVFEALRSQRSRQEVFQLRRKLSALERERASLVHEFDDPVVLPRRWIRTGSAATSSDGGCLVYIDKISPAIRTAELTVRVDGDAILQKHPVHVGERLEAGGKYGTYILKLYATEAVQANLAIALRSHHTEADQLP